MLGDVVFLGELILSIIRRSEGVLAIYACQNEIFISIIKIITVSGIMITSADRNAYSNVNNESTSGLVFFFFY